MAKTERSIVEYYAEHERYRCGYCGSSDTNYSHGMWAHALTVQDYQDLIDRGWRRSGKYCYKPTMNLTCCPQYSIRCDALNFHPSNSQKKIIKRVNRYLITGQKPGNHEADPVNLSGCGDQGPCGDSFVRGKKLLHTLSAEDVKIDRTTVSAVTAGSAMGMKSKKEKADGSENVENKGRSEKGGSGDSADFEAKSAVRQGQGPDSSKLPCRKAKQMRLERKMQKTGLSLEEIRAKVKHNEGKSLEDLLSEPLRVENPAHHLEIRLVRTSPASQESEAAMKSSHGLFKKYQMSVHKEKENECSLGQYTGFLVDSPLQPMVHEAGEPGFPEGYGSFHQHYLLDGKLIAVGVVDVLPHCLSSVYLYYDPDYNFLSLGTYSALRELAFVRELNIYDPDIRYYYMGFYIHSCPKMRYKGQYQPSFLLCPEAFTWLPIERCIPKLIVCHYARLEEPGKADLDGLVDVNQVLVLHDREAMAYEVYRIMSTNEDDQEEVNEYAKMTGLTCAKRMLLFRK